MAQSPLLRTKFLTPNFTNDLVKRKILKDRFLELQSKPIMLVSASSGFGKSTAIASFLEESNHLNAWLSLSERDNDLNLFIRYFVTAIKNVNDKIGEETLEVNLASETHSPFELADILSNELSELSQMFILTLDDYHLIKNTQIHQFVERLIEFPHPSFRLIIISRRDPELPIFFWRSKNQLVEIRTRDLRFSKDEIKEFCVRSKIFEPNSSLIDNLYSASEGWILGLRLMLASIKSEGNVEEYFSLFKSKNRNSLSRLFEGIFQLMKPPIKQAVLRLSILAEFNKSLFEAVCNTEDDPIQNLSFEEFIQEMIQRNLFLIVLDEKQGWYRFHHLFSEHLRELLDNSLSNEVISAIHNEVANWFLGEGQEDEAVIHFVNAGRTKEALKVFSKFRTKCISSAQFAQLDYVFQFFSEELLATNGMLYLTNIWLKFFRGDIPRMAEMLNHADKLLHTEDLDKEELSLYLGEVYSLKSYDKYLLDVDMNECKRLTQEAINLIDGRNDYASGLAWVFYGGSLQILGEPDKAKQDIYDALQHTENVSMKSQLLLILWYIDWFECDLSSAIGIAERLLELGLQTGYKMAIYHGHYFKAHCHYMRHENDDAIKGFSYQLKASKYFALKVIALPSWIRLMKLYRENSEMDMTESIRHQIEKFVHDHSLFKES